MLLCLILISLSAVMNLEQPLQSLPRCGTSSTPKDPPVDDADPKPESKQDEKWPPPANEPKVAAEGSARNWNPQMSPALLFKCLTIIVYSNKT